MDAADASVFARVVQLQWQMAYWNGIGTNARIV